MNIGFYIGIVITLQILWKIMSKRIFHCGICGQAGHTKRSCPGKIEEITPDPEISDQAAREGVQEAVHEVEDEISVEDPGSAARVASNWEDVPIASEKKFGEKIREKLGSIVGKKKISLDGWCRMHMDINYYMCAFPQVNWLASPGLVEMKEEENQGAELDFKHDPRCWWPRDHYGCWNRHYPKILKIFNLGDYGLTGVFLYKTLQIVVLKYQLSHTPGPPPSPPVEVEPDE